MEIIGLSGYARTGKDEAASVLIEKFGFQKVAFADKLREFLYALDPVVTEKSWIQECRDAPYCGPHVKSEKVRVRSVVDTYGWEGAKKSEYKDEIRDLLQRTGTEAGRNVLGDNIWVDAALTGCDPSGRVVVTDVRFPNEARRVKELGGIVVRVERPGIEAVNRHVSETALDHWDFDYTLDNNAGDLAAWHNSVEYWYTLNKQLEAADRG